MPSLRTSLLCGSLLSASLLCCPLPAFAATGSLTPVNVPPSLMNYPMGTISNDGQQALVLSVIDMGMSQVRTYYWSQTGGAVQIAALDAGQDYTIAILASSDFSVAAGVSKNAAGENRAIRWTSGSGTVDLGTLGGDASYVNGMSSNGSIIVGWAENAINDHRAFRWVQGVGMSDLGTFGGDRAEALSLSSDGTVVVGWAENGASDRHAFRWVQGVGLSDLGLLGGGTYSRAVSVSSDGSVVAGRADNNLGEEVLFRWTAGTNMVSLGNAGAADFYDTVMVSANGNTIAALGRDSGTMDDRVYVWTSASGTLSDIGTLGGAASQLSGISADGTIVVGFSADGGGGDAPFRWTESGGMQSLASLLQNANVDLTGITLMRAGSISSNGEYIGVVGLDGANMNAYIVRYTESGGAAGLTTLADQQDAAQNMAADTQGRMIVGRSALNALTGFASPIGTQTEFGAQGLLGSALGLATWQSTKDDLTFLAGMSYGTQDTPHVRQDGANTTFALGLRYAPWQTPAFNGTLRAYGEMGLWGTPDETVRKTRLYANGAGQASGTGTADSVRFGASVKGGLVWETPAHHQWNLFADLGREYALTDGYTENTDASNPFPAQVDSAKAHMNTARLGLSYTHQWTERFSMTLAGAGVRSFGVDEDVDMYVSGIGRVSDKGDGQSWGEYGLRLQADVTKSLALNLSLLGTTGGDASGRGAMHVGAGVSYKF